MIGKTISHYRIIEKIGQGGMGVVYKAEDTTLHRTVALKFLPPHLSGAREEMARFVHEARAAAALSHPNICTIYEIDEDAEQPFIAMAYIEGRDLKEITAHGPLSLDDAVRYASQVARALEEAHAEGVVHRDIKSANVVVSEKGHAIVMDFGLAKMRGQTRLTQTGTTVGTVAYMSPELARGDEADHRTDIWSLGVMLYRMVAGRYPFDAEHQAAVMYSIMNEPPRPLSALRTDVPLDLERIVDKALAKVPAERYQSVSDMIVDLKAVRRGLGGADKSDRRPVTPKRRPLGSAWVAGLAAVVVVAALFAWTQFTGKRDGGPAESGASADERVSIAVLPLDNMSPDEDQEYVADGMTEALITELAKVHSLRVISRTSVMRFKETRQSIQEVAAALGVNTIIEGSVVQAGGRVRVTAQLIDATTDEHLWAESYDRDLSDVLALQSEVARAIVDQVKVELTPGESDRLASAGSVDPRAWDYYLRGRHHWNRRTETDLERAQELFEKAIGAQPEWATAYSALAQTKLVMASWSVLPPGEAYPSARELAQKALELDPNLGSGWACLAGIEAEWEWNWALAEQHARKAIELEPNSVEAHQWYAELLVSLGRFDEAIEEIELAQEIDPLALVVGLVKAWIYKIAGDTDRAIAECTRIIELDPDFAGVWLILGGALGQAGLNDRAAEAYARYYGSFVPGAGETLRSAYAEGGMDALMRAVIEGARQEMRKSYVSPTYMGLHFAAIGEADSAMAWFEKAYETHAYPLSLVAVNWDCKPIRNDPRFIDLLDRLGLEDVKPAYARD